ncbi:hypothetical protein R1sor_009809 [Riccia sorocarpa]|uniref:F-box domain-containing protein n=1 Tax=Riccia sorocarpa TaxID=122646 RepID=A0ABD3HW52_9MARC
MLSVRDKDIGHDDEKFMEDSGRHRQDLPEDLVEKILARMSFPHIFKVRLLSKHWYSKISKTELMGSQQSVFLNEIRGFASQWPTYCPAFISHDWKSGGAFVHGFNRSTESWEKFRIPKKIPYLSQGRCKTGTALRGAILVFDVSGIYGQRELIVANVVTGAWRQMPSCPLPTRIFSVQVYSNAGGAYEVLVYGKKYGENTFDYLLYSSESSSWSTCSKRELPVIHEIAYVDGCLYELSRMNDHWTLVRRNWESGVEVAVRVSYRRHEKMLRLAVLQCVSKVLVVTVFRRVNSSVASSEDNRARVYEVSLEDPLIVTVVSESPARVVPQTVDFVFSAASVTALVIKYGAYIQLQKKVTYRGLTSGKASRALNQA